MEIEKLSYLALANGLVDAVEEILEVDDQEKRLLLNQFLEILRPMCKAVSVGDFLTILVVLDFLDSVEWILLVLT